MHLETRERVQTRRREEEEEEEEEERLYLEEEEEEEEERGLIVDLKRHTQLAVAWSQGRHLRFYLFSTFLATTFGRRPT